MNGIKSIQWISHSISLVKLEGIVLLRLYIYSDNFKPCSSIANRAAAGTTEQIKQSRFGTVRLCYRLCIIHSRGAHHVRTHRALLVDTVAMFRVLLVT
jgi:hypothetical protein